MLTQFEAGGLHPGMAYVLDGEPASTSPEHALVLVGSPCARVRSGSIASFWQSADHFRSTPINGHRPTGPVGPVGAINAALAFGLV
jgi:hypothetical protein